MPSVYVVVESYGSTVGEGIPILVFINEEMAKRKVSELNKSEVNPDATYEVVECPLVEE